MENLKAKNFIYPLISILSSVAILVIGLLLAKSIKAYYFLGGVWLLMLCFGYYKSCFAVIPVAVIMTAIFCALTYAISKDTSATMSAGARILAVCVAVIPGMALPPWALVSNLSALRVPRMVTLGMMIALSFFPLLRKETKQIKEAMRTRGAGSILNPKIFYRAFLIPLVIRLVNISDTLALSVETRGFDVQGKDYTIYKKVKFRALDALFLCLFVIVSVLAIVLG